MKKVELLAPAGGYEQFIAAVENGADAIYLGGTVFNARNFANNFDDEALSRAIKYAHVRNVKIYVTLNTLVNDEEILDAYEFAKKVYLMGADAFIIQDVGLASLLRKKIPGINIHLSTQGSVYSTDGIKAFDNLNFERVVLARELSIDEIENVCKNTNKEIEVFVHGALCVSYSGQCRFSSMVGERSGNRGKCAQPCRLKYSLVKNNEELTSNYCMSPKDLCGIYDLPRLIEAGVTSLKIEGRMKSPEYVACVTSIYRKYIDLYYCADEEYKVCEEDVKKLLQVFNRGNFNRAYFDGNKNPKEFVSRTRPKHWGTYLGTVLSYDSKRKLVKARLNQELNMGDGIEILNDELSGNIVTYIECNGKQIKEAGANDIVCFGDIKGNIKAGEEIYKISDKKLNDSLGKSYTGKFFKKVPINIYLTAKIGQKISVVLEDEDGHYIEEISDYVGQIAEKISLTKENAYKSISKLGDTPFFINEFNCEIDENVLVPVSVLNDLRRKATEKLVYEREKICVDTNVNNEEIILDRGSRKNIKVSVYLYNTKNLEGLEEADRIYVPIEDFDNIDKTKFGKAEVIPYVSAITKNIDYSKNYDKVLVGNAEHIEIFKNSILYGDYSLNVFNSYSCKYLKDLGLKSINLSFELNLEQIENIVTDIETEVTVYGRLPLMISEHCPIGGEIGGKTKCGLCAKEDYSLKDRTGVTFPIVTDARVCRSMILNSKILCAVNETNNLKGKVDYVRAYFYDEDTKRRREIIRAIKTGQKISCAGSTAGHFYRGV